MQMTEIKMLHSDTLRDENGRPIMHYHAGKVECTTEREAERLIGEGKAERIEGENVLIRFWNNLNTHHQH